MRASTAQHYEPISSFSEEPQASPPNHGSANQKELRYEDLTITYSHGTTMKQSSFEAVITEHSATVWRVCMMYLPQKADAEDAFQQTFVKYASCEQGFQDEEHRKAWLIRVATNTCKDMLRAMHTHADPLEDYSEISEANADFVGSGLMADRASEATADDETLSVQEALANLPEEYRLPLYLMYFDGYTATEIADMLDTPVNTVYTHLARGRARLKEMLNHD